MKTITKNNEIKRVSDDKAYDMVQKDGWKFCGKELWKKLVRDVNKK